MQTGQGYLGSEKIEISTANEEVIPSSPDNWTSGYKIKKFSFYNEEECTVEINKSKTLYLRARQGFEMSYRDLPLSSFVIKEGGVGYNWAGSY